MVEEDSEGVHIAGIDCVDKEIRFREGTGWVCVVGEEKGEDRRVGDGSE